MVNVIKYYNATGWCLLHRKQTKNKRKIDNVIKRWNWLEISWTLCVNYNDYEAHEHTHTHTIQILVLAHNSKQN